MTSHYERIDNIEMARLDNGLTVVVETMPWLSSASMNFSFPMGTIGDPVGQEGSSVVLYDWLERGAGDLNSVELANAFNDLGLRRGGGVSRESMGFSASMLVDAFSETVALHADVLRRPKLLTEEFEPSRQLALQELASLDDEPTSKLFIALAERYFSSEHGRSSYGSQEGLEALTAESVAADYKARVSPNGMIISVAGGITFDEVIEQINLHFGDWQGPAIAMPAVSVNAPSYSHIASESSQTQIGLVFPSVSPNNIERYKENMALNVLSGGMASRLFSEVREKRGLVYSVSAFRRTVKDYGYTMAYAGTTPERANETLTVLLAELERLHEGVTGEELERARTGVLSNLVMQGESSGARASSSSRSTFLLGKPSSLAEVKAVIDAITLDEVNAYLASKEKPKPTIMSLGQNELEVEA